MSSPGEGSFRSEIIAKTFMIAAGDAYVETGDPQITDDKRRELQEVFRLDDLEARICVGWASGEVRAMGDSVTDINTAFNGDES